MELNLNKIKLLGEKREDENFRFRAFLKGVDTDKADRIVHRLHHEISSQIDCTKCGNCCKMLRPAVNHKEIIRLAHIKNISTEEFEKKYVKKDEYGDVKYLKDTPCIFLKDKRCAIYQDRPDECRSYPHTHKDEFISRLFGVIDNYSICPIVFNLYEQLKGKLYFRKSGRRY
jgi:uncharacterized protein